MARKFPKPSTHLAAMLAWETGGPKINKPFHAAVTAEAIARLAARLHRIADMECNGLPVTERRDGKKYEYNVWSAENAAWAEKQRASIAKKATALLEPFGAKLLTVHGDPRGFVIRFELKSGATNGSGEGWGL